MKIVAVNGSPRKSFNTATLLSSFLDGAKAAAPDADARMVHLYDLAFTGCVECYSCQLKGGPSLGRCGRRDGVTDILEETASADVIAFGSPIFFHYITGQLRCFLERFFYPHISFRKGEDHYQFPRKIRSAFVFTMNVNEEQMRAYNYPEILAGPVKLAGQFLGHSPEVLCAYNTYQYTDYDKYDVGSWDESKKRAWRDEHFPMDCRAAFELGKKLAGLA